MLFIFSAQRHSAMRETLFARCLPLRFSFAAFDAASPIIDAGHARFRRCYYTSML